ncbi:hypothetical protein SO694_00018220 [Aureococcus anophagefferens]|uniref:Uncharacterized protein n=1 Tax=Aureococcus anophagefferens TaxID=44056 RepID=A0ABR1G0X9_AURAN
MSQLSATDLQKRLLLIGNAAKARNPTGFVDEVKRRVGDGKPAPPPPPPEERLSWVVLEPSTRLERSLAAATPSAARACARGDGDARAARAHRPARRRGLPAPRPRRRGRRRRALRRRRRARGVLRYASTAASSGSALAAPSAFAAAAARSRAFAAAAARGGLRQLCVAEVDAALKRARALRSPKGAARFLATATTT